MSLKTSLNSKGCDKFCGSFVIVCRSHSFTQQPFTPSSFHLSPSSHPFILSSLHVSPSSLHPFISSSLHPFTLHPFIPKPFIPSSRSWTMRCLNIPMPGDSETDTRMVILMVYDSLLYPILYRWSQNQGCLFQSA